MSNRFLCRILLVLMGAAALLFSQETQEAGPPLTPPEAPPQAQSPVAKQPQIKSQKELEAIQAITNALDPNSRMKACDDLVADFPDSEFKAFALQMATISAQMLNDYDKMMIYGERTLEADPNNYVVMLAMANALAQRTREFDLDKEEKLKRAEDLANKALELLATAPRPNPQVTDEQWEQAKADFSSQAHEALGLVALVRKNYNVAVEEFKKAIDIAHTPNAATKVRYAAALNQQGNHDEAIVVLDDVLSDAQLHPTIRQIAQSERLRAVKLKEAKAKK